MFLGREIRRWRDRAGITQKQFARIAGMAPSTLSALETHGRGMKMKLFVRLCQLLGADPKVVSDHAYYEFRKSLGEEAKKWQAEAPKEEDAGRSAIPSLEEVMQLYDAAAAAQRSFFRAVLRSFRPDLAVSAFLADSVRDFDLEAKAPRARAGETRRTPERPRRSS